MCKQTSEYNGKAVSRCRPLSQTATRVIRLAVCPCTQAASQSACVSLDPHLGTHPLTQPFVHMQFGAIEFRGISIQAEKEKVARHYLCSPGEDVLHGGQRLASVSAMWSRLNLVTPPTHSLSKPNTLIGSPG